MTRIEVAIAGERGSDLAHGTCSANGNLDPKPSRRRNTSNRHGGDHCVLRAFTTAAVALANGASSIVMVCLVEEALAVRDAGIGQICMVEVRGRYPMASISVTRNSRSWASI